MGKKILPKLSAILLAVSICIGMPTSLAYAANDTNNIIAGSLKKTVKRSARYIQPEEWNRQELIAYSFDSGKEVTKYSQTGGLHYYNKNYKSKDQWIKVTLADSGLFYVMTASDDGKIQIYDQSKKNRLDTLVALKKTEYLKKANAGDVFYMKLPKKIEEQSIVVAVLKDGFGTMEVNDSYGESGTGKTIYHPFSLKKRCMSYIALKVMYKNKGNVTAQIEKNEKGKWIKIGYPKVIKPGANLLVDDEKYVTNALQPGKYRVGLKTSKEQVYALAYGKSDVKKDVAYTRSKAKKIKKYGYVNNIYTQEETKERWYQFTRTSSDKDNVLSITKETNGGGFQFTIYKSGKKKPITTIKVTTNISIGIVKLPRGKGTYYVKVNKLTNKTNGSYSILDFNEFI